MSTLLPDHLVDADARRSTLNVTLTVDGHTLTVPRHASKHERAKAAAKSLLSGGDRLPTGEVRETVMAALNVSKRTADNARREVTETVREGGTWWAVLAEEVS